MKNRSQAHVLMGLENERMITWITLQKLHFISPDLISWNTLKRWAKLSENAGKWRLEGFQPPSHVLQRYRCERVSKKTFYTHTPKVSLRQDIQIWKAKIHHDSSVKNISIFTASALWYMEPNLAISSTTPSLHLWVWRYSKLTPKLFETKSKVGSLWRFHGKISNIVQWLYIIDKIQCSIFNLFDVFWKSNSTYKVKNKHTCTRIVIIYSMIQNAF